jgi:hypothetical protein
LALHHKAEQLSTLNFYFFISTVILLPYRYTAAHYVMCVQYV